MEGIEKNEERKREREMERLFGMRRRDGFDRINLSEALFNFAWLSCVCKTDMLVSPTPRL